MARVTIEPRPRLVLEYDLPHHALADLYLLLIQSQAEPRGLQARAVLDAHRDYGGTGEST